MRKTRASIGNNGRKSVLDINTNGGKGPMASREIQSHRAIWERFINLCKELTPQERKIITENMKRQPWR